MTANFIWSDDFSHDYFADSTYTTRSGFPSVAAHALTTTEEVKWHDERHPVPVGFAVARVWVDIAEIDDAGTMELLVGFQTPPTFSSLAMPDTGYDEQREDGVNGGPVMSGAMRVLELNLWTDDFDSGPESTVRDPITTGHVELILLADGTVTVTSPDGSTSNVIVPADALANWIAEGIYPQVQSVPNLVVGSPRTVFSGWGYEYDYPVVSSITIGAGARGQFAVAS